MSYHSSDLYLVLKVSIKNLFVDYIIYCSNKYENVLVNWIIVILYLLKNLYICIVRKYSDKIEIAKA